MAAAAIIWYIINANDAAVADQFSLWHSPYMVPYHYSYHSSGMHAIYVIFPHLHQSALVSSLSIHHHYHQSCAAPWLNSLMYWYIINETLIYPLWYTTIYSYVWCTHVPIICPFIHHSLHIIIIDSTHHEHLHCTSPAAHCTPAIYHPWPYMEWVYYHVYRCMISSISQCTYTTCSRPCTTVLQ